MRDGKGNGFREFSRDTAIRDYNSNMEAATEKGREQKAIETAQNMLKKNYPTSDIAEIIGLPAKSMRSVVCRFFS